MTLGRTLPDELWPVAKNWTWQHKTLTRDRHTWPRRDSNPQSQQACERRHSPFIARPLESAHFSVSYQKNTSVSNLTTTFERISIRISCLAWNKYYHLYYHLYKPKERWIKNTEIFNKQPTKGTTLLLPPLSTFYNQRKYRVLISNSLVGDISLSSGKQTTGKNFLCCGG